MKLIEYSNFNIKVSDEAFLIKPIRRLFNKDRSERKEKFFQQMSYLFFMTDPRSPYAYLINEEERSSEIIAQEGMDPSFKPSDELTEAMEIYKKMTTTTSSLLLEDTRIAVDNVRKFLRNVDLTALDDKGKPIYTINAVTTAIKQIPQLAKDLIEAEKVVAKDIEAESRARGGNDTMTIGDMGLDEFYN